MHIMKPILKKDHLIFFVLILTLMVLLAIFLISLPINKNDQKITEENIELISAERLDELRAAIPHEVIVATTTLVSEVGQSEMVDFVPTDNSIAATEVSLNEKLVTNEESQSTIQNEPSVTTKVMGSSTVSISASPEAKLVDSDLKLVQKSISGVVAIVDASAMQILVAVESQIYTVNITNKTKFKIGNEYFSFEDLKQMDKISITGVGYEDKLHIIADNAELIGVLEITANN